MAKGYMNSKLLILLGLPMAILAFQNCGNNLQFGAVPIESIGAAAKDPSSPSPGSSLTLKTVKVRIGATQIQSEVDIVWVIDNSPSMAEEADHVRRNVASFAANVRKSANLRMAMISQRGNSGTSVSLPSDPDFLHIDQEVTSWNGLLLAASAMCGSGGAASKTCRNIDDITNIKPYIFENPFKEIADSKAIRGSLRDFLSRKASKKVFVFVTDDNSSWSSANFLKVAEENLDGQVPMVSSFARLSSSKSPCGQRDGAAYIDLAAKTGGSVYNICQSDWSSTFVQLASDVERVIDRVIELPDGIQAGDVVSVLRSNKAIDRGLYQVTGSTIRLSQSLNLREGEYLQIVYQSAQ